MNWNEVCELVLLLVGIFPKQATGPTVLEVLVAASSPVVSERADGGTVRLYLSSEECSIALEATDVFKSGHWDARY
jgi:hypothetical protein